jgi:hypothetical protein
MKGKLSCPVLKAARREQSLLPGYQNKLHYRCDGSLGEDACQTRTGSVSYLLAFLNYTALGLVADVGKRTCPRREAPSITRSTALWLG